MKRAELLNTLDELLKPETFKDYCPNGLQIQGADQIQRIVCGVSASEALIDEAIRREADTIIVHHGYFWKNESPRIIGIKRNRIAKILAHNINLIAYHLPLDANETVGNNYEMARALKLQNVRATKSNPLVLMGEFYDFVTTEELANKIEGVVHRPPFVVPVDSDASIKTVAFCSGAAQDFLEDAAAEGADAYLSGEISERTVLEARELGIPYFSVGHHAGETLGIQALAVWIGNHFPEINVSFVGIDNPV